ncbi:MAG: apolipoprotein N-acyltransferase, partial [Longimicrobiales bacterium]
MLPVLSGLLLTVSFPPFHLLLPSFVALVPLVLHLRALPEGRPGGGQAFRAGTVTGLVYFGLLLHWLVPALLWLNPLGPFLYLVVVILLGGLVGIAAWATHRLEHEAGVPGILALPLAWVAVEWLRGHLPGGLAFPWLGLGTSLTNYPELVGVAELVGARGVSFWLVLVNALVAEVLWAGAPRVARSKLRSRARGGSGAERDAGDGLPGEERTSVTPVGTLGALAVVLVVPATWGLWRAATLPTAPVARLALARTQVSAEVKADPARAMDVTRGQLREMGFGDGRSSFGDPDLLVWPETTIPFPPSSRRETVGAVVERAAGEEEAPLLFGAVEVGAGGPAGSGVEPGGIQAAEYNATFLFVPSADTTGELRSVYRKRFLVPVVERAPRLLPAFLPVPEGLLEAVGAGGSGRAEGAGELTPGDAGDPVPLPGGDPSGSAPRFGVLICFESALPDASREYRRDGADFLVNVTNDVWFADGTWLPTRAGA